MPIIQDSVCHQNFNLLPFFLLSLSPWCLRNSSSFEIKRKQIKTSIFDFKTQSLSLSSQSFSCIKKEKKKKQNRSHSYYLTLMIITDFSQEFEFCNLDMATIHEDDHCICVSNQPYLSVVKQIWLTWYIRILLLTYYFIQRQNSHQSCDLH